MAPIGQPVDRGERDLIAGIREGKRQKEYLAVGELVRCVLLRRCLLFLEVGVKGTSSVRLLLCTLMRPLPAGGQGIKGALKVVL
jgi:hypothetical protein